MSAKATSGIHINKRLSTLELNGGNPALSRNWQEPVDLKIKGGIQVFKTLCVAGNIDVDQNFTVCGNLTSKNIFAGNISSSLSAVNVSGNICGNIKVNGDTVVKQMKSTGPLTTGSFEHYGWLGPCVQNSMQDTEVCALDNDTITFVSSGTTVATITKKGGIQYGTGTATGKYATASGFGTMAIGNFSHAEGNVTVSSGLASHAQNVRTTASGDYSHAQGESTTASSMASFAQGRSTISSGRSSHAEGLSTVASGAATHVEGRSNTGPTDYSYLEGSMNMSSTATGIDHMEGLSNLATTGSGASGLAHIEGGSNLSTGYVSHIEGCQNEASSGYCHVGGYQAIGSQHAQWARSAGRISVDGDAQTSMFHLRTEIMGNISQSLDLNFPTAPQLFPIVPTGECWMMEIQLVGRDEISSDYYAEKIECLASNDSGTLTVQATPIHKFEIGTLVGTTTSLSASGTDLVLEVTSASINPTRWAATLLVTQVF